MFATAKAVYFCFSCLFTFSTCIWIGQPTVSSTSTPRPQLESVVDDAYIYMVKAIGNFSIELLYHTKSSINKNFIISPLAVWTSMAAMLEGATGDTAAVIKNALRINVKLQSQTTLQNVVKQLSAVTNSVQLEYVNTVFSDVSHLITSDFSDLIKRRYNVPIIAVNFTDSGKTSELINLYISRTTHEKITKLVKSMDLILPQLIVANALYFKGQWTSAFNASATVRRSFYDSQNRQIGIVNMMYHRYNYPFASIGKLQAKVLELPYGKDKGFSIIIVLPNQGITLDKMIKNFGNVLPETILDELKASADFGRDEVDCYLPRFKIESDLALNIPLQQMGLHPVFDEKTAEFPLVSRTPVYVSQFIHKAIIEVVEQGTPYSEDDSPLFTQLNSVIQFNVNRPFAYFIIDKTSNAIVFGGLYILPILY